MTKAVKGIYEITYSKQDDHSRVYDSFRALLPVTNTGFAAALKLAARRCDPEAVISSITLIAAETVPT